MPHFNAHRKRRKQSSKNSKNPKSSTGLLLFSGIFFLLGSGLFVLGILSLIKEISFSQWEEVPCSVERFEIHADPNADPHFEADVSYHYQYGGQSYTGSHLFPEDNGSDDYETLAEARYHSLTQPSTTCRIDSQSPENSSLLQTSKNIIGALVLTAVGALFAAVGIGVFLSRRSEKNKTALSARNEKSSTRGKLLAFCFFALFAAVGLSIFFTWSYPKHQESHSSKHWVETPATVIWGKVRETHGDDGTTYAVDLFYRYQFENITHHSNRWRLVESSSSGRQSKQATVDAHPPGSSTVCYVNPEAPWQAVLQRELGMELLLLAIPLLFAIFGIAGMIGTTLWKAPSSTISKRPPKSLKSQRWKKFYQLLFFAVIWNGITGILASAFLSEGPPDTPLIIFLTIFGIAGAILIGSAVYYFIRIFSPCYDLVLPKETLIPGEQLNLQWKQISGHGMPRSFKLWLIGEEEATYKRGTDTVTDHAIFHESLLYETTSWHSMASGQCELEIPPMAVPSFESKNNSIRWTLRLEADIPLRPDVRDTLDLVITNSKSPIS